ncbi:MAG: hypothetical protein ACRBDI_00175 [Alphaproteobacteria bacterium]
MSFIFKILFAALVFIIVGTVTFIAIKDVSVPQDTVTKEISATEAIK